MITHCDSMMTPPALPAPNTCAALLCSVFPSPILAVVSGWPRWLASASTDSPRQSLGAARGRAGGRLRSRLWAQFWSHPRPPPFTGSHLIVFAQVTDAGGRR
jgi:hypothetical protein